MIHNWERSIGKKVKRKGEDAARPIANDGVEADEIFKAVLPEFKRLLKHGGCCCCCGGGGGPDPQFARWSLWIDEILSFKQMIVVDKGSMGLGWHYRRSWECVLVAQRDDGKCNWYDKSDRVENIIRPGDYGIRKILPKVTDHPTPKPVELAAHFIRLHTKPGDVVLDCFAGCGWVGVACKKLNRNFIGIEIDPVWFKKMEERLAKIQTGFFSSAAD